MLVPKHDLLSLLKLSDGDLIHEARSFAQRIRGHAAFQDAQAHVPVADTFESLADVLWKRSNAAKYGDKLMAEDRDKTREEIITNFIFACQHTVMVATHRKDPSLMEVGYQFTHRAYVSKPATASLPGQPSKLEIKYGPKGSGIYWLYVNKVAGMGSVEAQFTENPNDESSWISAERSYKCKVEMKGDLVKRYYIRARYHNSAGYGPWSSVIDIVLS